MLILASSSPRRRELLTRCGAFFSVHSVPVEEVHSGKPPRELLALNAARKAEAAAKDHPEDTVIGADTGIIFENTLIGKPADLADAAAILRRLSGKTHEVCTAVALRGDRQEDFISVTEVRFKTLSETVIQEYLKCVPVLDKAGAYALQDHGGMIVESVTGDRDNVVGLPCTELMAKLGRAHVCRDLFWEFAKITTMVLGGGYVILAAIESEFVRHRKWITETEFADLAATAQTVPGIIAGNAAIALGFRMKGWRGAIAAMFGTVIPPMLVMMVIAAGAAHLPQEAPWVRGMFTGVNACIAGLIAATAWRMRRKSAKGVIPWLIALTAFAGMAFLHRNPGALMIGAMLCGFWYQAFLVKKESGGK